MSFVEVEDLRLQLGGRAILDGVGFTVAAGESVALTGPNGSGKTSILRCLLGLVPFRGRATIGGHDAAGIAARALTGYLPQKPAFGEASAREVLRFVARVRRLDATRIPEVLETVNLLRHADERVRTFSGGMQQRLSLAIVLLTGAPLLLLDEPTASLDGDGQQAFARIVAGLRQKGRTLILASHRPEEIHQLTDRVIALDEGRVTPANVVALHAGARR